jgi:hypothetical protein
MRTVPRPPPRGVWTSNPVAAKGAESAVATVPGCKAIQSASGDRRANSTAAVRTIWLRAALDARYEYQPPSRLSPMLPTLADRVGKTTLSDRGNSGSTCFMISAGPMAFSATERARLPASRWRQLFSGPWRSSWRNPVASITSRSSPFSAANVAARARLVSSSRSMDGEVLRLKPTTCSKLLTERNVSISAPPIPPPAPKTTATPAFGNELRSTLDVAPVDAVAAPVNRALPHQRGCRVSAFSNEPGDKGPDRQKNAVAKLKGAHRPGQRCRARRPAPSWQSRPHLNESGSSRQKLSSSSADMKSFHGAPWAEARRNGSIRF